ncbi:hypothetical protein RUM43_008166 [Polyplax serrata]|uniref:Uncharacterized protein n=1 Tax=Polyplax serrata TaxID=468196 RepID=A0AAN8PND5_POLSC
MEVCSEPAKEKIEFRDIMRKIWESNTFCSPCDVILLDNDGLGDVGQAEKEEWKRGELHSGTGCNRKDQLVDRVPTESEKWLESTGGGMSQSVRSCQKWKMEKLEQIR